MSGGGKSQKYHVGYKYFLGVQKLLCHGPIDATRGMWVEDKKLDDWVREPGQHTIYEPELFGEQQGGISGTFDVVEGTLDQPVNTYLSSVIKDPLPAFRGVASLVLNRMYLGNNPYLKPWSVNVSRIMKRIVNGETVDQWYKEKATVMGEADPELIADLKFLKFEDGTVVTNTSQPSAAKYFHMNLEENKGYYHHSDSNTMLEFNANSMVVERSWEILETSVLNWRFRGMVGDNYFIFTDPAVAAFSQWAVLQKVIGEKDGEPWPYLSLKSISQPSAATSTGANNPLYFPTHNGIHSGEKIFTIGSNIYSTQTGSHPRVTRFTGKIEDRGVGEHRFQTNSIWPDFPQQVNLGDSLPPTMSNTSLRNVRGVIEHDNAFTMLLQGYPYTVTGFGFKVIMYRYPDTGQSVDKWEAVQDWIDRNNDSIVENDGPIKWPAQGSNGTSEIIREYGTDFQPLGLFSSNGKLFVLSRQHGLENPRTVLDIFDIYFVEPPIRIELDNLYIHVNALTDKSTSENQGYSFLDGKRLYCFKGDDSFDYHFGYIDVDLGVFVPLGRINDGTSDFVPEFYVTDSRSGSVWGSYLSNPDGKLIKFGGGGNAICPDMNPAHIIRECLTDQIWGLGYGDADIDDTSFTSAADQLFKEGFGLSLLWGRQTPIEDFVGIVLDHIDANLYVNRITGKFVLKLIRDDYTTYPTFSDSDIIEVSDFAQRPESELINSLTVTYNDRKKRTTTSITVNDLAAIQQYGATIHTTVNYPGIYNHKLAAKVAARDLRALSSPVYNGTIVVNRKTATDLNVGDVFDIDSTLYPELSGRVYRVGEINFGNSSRSNVTITFVEDVFTLGTAVAENIGQIGTGSTLVSQPIVPEYPAIFEADFYTYSRALGDQTVSENLAYEDERSAAILYADQVVSDALTFDVYSDITGSYTRINGTNPSPVLTLTEDLTADPDQTTVGVSFAYGEDLYGELTGNILAYVNSEIIQITDITSGTATIIRGVGDTVPSAHTSGDAVRVFSQTSELDLSDLVNGDSVTYKLATRTLAGTVPLEDCDEILITFTGRLDKPWPVNNLSYNGSNYMVPFAGSANLTWANQDRYLLTGATPPDYLDASSGLETNTTNNVTVTSYNWAGSFLATEVSASTTSESYTIDTSTFNGSAFYAIAEVQVANTVNSKANHQTASLTLIGGTKSNLNGILEWYDSTYFNTEFYEDSARTTLLSDTANNVAIGAADDVTGSANYVYQDSVGSEPIFKAAGGTYAVPYMDFSTDKSFKYDSTVAETIYVYYMRPDGTFSNLSQSVVIGANTLNLSGEVFQFVISSDELTILQRDIVRNIMSQGFDSLVGTWSDNSTWLDSETWTE